MLSDDPIEILWNPLKIKKKPYSKFLILGISWFIILSVEPFTLLYFTYAYQTVDSDDFFDVVMNVIILHLVNILPFSSTTYYSSSKQHNGLINKNTKF